MLSFIHLLFQRFLTLAMIPRIGQKVYMGYGFTVGGQPWERKRLARSGVGRTSRLPGGA